ncbi:DUF5683 domain-containing protein [Ferruginibacter sp. SUN002]|uniref:DUF5683 domain-containing protein n=1 Tax=Ferruginibacter sp. SUN002 TaxID=2937789 RepID=UPI003D364EDC
MQRILLIFFLLTVIYSKGYCLQITDTIVIPKLKTVDTAKNKFKPRTATIRSAILPGWGQIYNKKYWKLPLVYGALGTTAGIFVYNVKNYKRLKQGYIYKLAGQDSLIYFKFRNLSAGSLKTYRNIFRQNVDYSALFFIVFWGLNVVDATVDAHLKSFDVSDDLSLHIKAGYSPQSNTSGVSLVLNIGK